MTMTLGPRSVMEMGTSLVLFFFKSCFEEEEKQEVMCI